MAATIPKSGIVTASVVYLDDSGTNAKEQDRFLWAGYHASLGFWEKFGNEWNRILNRDPQIPYWHQTDARARISGKTKTPYDRIDPKIMKRRESSLAYLISKNLHQMTPYAVSVSHADLNVLAKGKIQPSFPPSKGQRKVIRALESSSFLALFCTAKCVVSDSPSGEDQLPVSLICEESSNSPYQRLFQQMWDLIRKSEPRMGSLDFRKGKTQDAPHLQAADMLAWHVNHRWDLQKWGTPEADRHWSQVTGADFDEVEIEPDNIRQMVRDISKFDTLPSMP